MRVIAGTGHRPNKLCGYAMEPYAVVIDHLARRFSASAQAESLTIVSGMALGWDLLIAAAAIQARGQGAAVRLVCAVPCEGQDSRWPRSEARDLYHTYLGIADEVVLVSPGPYTATCMQRRNEWMVDRAAANPHGLILACWNGTPGGTANCIRSAEQRGVPITNVWSHYFG